MPDLNLNNKISSILFTTIRIETTDGKNTSIGTGFIVHSTKGKPEPKYIITNKHVIENSKTGIFYFNTGVNKKPKLGETYPIEISDFEKIWHKHPNGMDICLTTFDSALNLAKERNVDLFYRSIPTTIFPNQSQLNDFDVYEEVCFVGYPTGLYDKKHNLPIYRTGTTATHIALDYDGKSVFLIDASVFPGSSGSPVFVYNPNFYREGNTIVAGSRLIFVGLISETMVRNELGEVEIIEIPTNHKGIIKLSQMINLGVVIKWTEVNTLIEDFEAKIRSNPPHYLI